MQPWQRAGHHPDRAWTLQRAAVVLRRMKSRFTVKVVPGASRDEVAGWHGEAVKIRVRAAPEKGRANKAVIALLARYLELPARDVTICAGHASANKVVEVRGLTDAGLCKKLAAISR